jgi:hypothetical protein
MFVLFIMNKVYSSRELLPDGRIIFGKIIQNRPPKIISRPEKHGGHKTADFSPKLAEKDAGNCFGQIYEGEPPYFMEFL